MSTDPLVILGRLIEACPDPILADTMWRQIRWFAARGRFGLRRRAARTLRCRLQRVPGRSLTQALHRTEDPWVGRDRVGDQKPNEEDGTHDAYRRHAERTQEAAARAYIRHEPDAARAAAELTGLIERRDRVEMWLATSGGVPSSQPWTFFFTLGRLDPHYAERLATAIAEIGTGTWGTLIAALTAGARKAGAALGQLQSLGHGTDAERLAAAQTLHTVFGSGKPTSEEWGLLKKLLSDTHPDTQTTAVHAWRAALRSTPEMARPLLLEIIPGRNQTAGLELFQTVEYRLGALDDAETGHLLRVAYDLRSIDDPSVLSFLRTVASSDPQTVFDLLMSRVERESEDLTALPFETEQPLFADMPDALRADFLSQTVRLLLDAAPSGSSYPAYLLFSALASGSPTIAVTEAVNLLGGGDDMADVALSLLRDLPERFPVTSPDAVRSILDAAQQGGGIRRREQASSALASVVRSGMRQRQIGSPCPDDVWQKEAAQRVADRLTGEPRLRSFYLSLVKAATASIENGRKNDAEDRAAS